MILAFVCLRQKHQTTLVQPIEFLTQYQMSHRSSEMLATVSSLLYLKQAVQWQQHYCQLGHIPPPPQSSLGICCKLSSCWAAHLAVLTRFCHAWISRIVDIYHNLGHSSIQWEHKVSVIWHSTIVYLGVFQCRMSFLAWSWVHSIMSAPPNLYVQKILASCLSGKQQSIATACAFTYFHGKKYLEAPPLKSKSGPRAPPYKK